LLKMVFISEYVVILGDMMTTKLNGRCLMMYITMRRGAKTAEERAAENVAKRARMAEEDEIVARASWKPIHKGKEVFVQRRVPREHAFTRFRLRAAALNDWKYFDIFEFFINDAIMERLEAEYSQCHLFLKARGEGVAKNFKLSRRIMWQTFAVYIRIVAFQNAPTENETYIRQQRWNIEEARAHFISRSGSCCQRDVIVRLLGNMLMDESYDKDISINFQSIVDSLGEYASLDEKLWSYTGKGPGLRMCPNKHERVGLWMYEICVPLADGRPYCLWLRMHNSSVDPVTTVEIIESCLDAIENCSTDEEGVKNPHTYLAMDSYYTTRKGVDVMLERGRPFTCSLKPDRFKPETKFIHPPGYNPKVGEWHGMYNEEKGLCMVYHFDRQKGVGEKYNISHGFDVSTKKCDVKEYKDFIPGYESYKVMFGMCDIFNRAFHDRSWPHKRSGGGRTGEIGRHHDFLMTCILQNTRNAYHAIMGTDQHRPEFKRFCIDLSNQIFDHSLEA
jgi:hypothetical protein